MLEDPLELMLSVVIERLQLIACESRAACDLAGRVLVNEVDILHGLAHSRECLRDLLDYSEGVCPSFLLLLLLAVVVVFAMRE